MFWARAALTLLSLAVCSFAPGFILVRRLPWRPLEKLCGSIAASLILIYLATGAVYCLAPASETGIFRAIAFAAGAIAVWQWRDIRRLASSFGVRQALNGFAFLLLWSLLALGIIRTFSGAGWSADWLEHFQRSLFFLYHLPEKTKFIGLYILPARPPMMNLLCAFFMAQTGDLFEIYQLVFVFLNLLPFLACCLLLGAVNASRQRAYVALAALFALNPMMMENAWYPWTKMFAAFFILFAIALYLAGLRKRDSLRIVCAFISLAAGLLAHYSAGPYVVFLAGHYLLRVFVNRPHRIRELAAIAGCCGILLATWFGWSIAHYGLHDTLASNTSVTDSQKFAGSAARKIAVNMLDTIVPPVLRDSKPFAVFAQGNQWGELRDDFFALYQKNLIIAMGMIGGLLAIYLLYRAWRSNRARTRERNFWLAFVPLVFVLGIAVVGERDSIGLAHLTLLPLVTLGLTLLAASVPGRRTLAVLLLAGCAIDFTAGILLQVRVENLENSPARTAFNGLTTDHGQIIMGAQGPDSLSQAAWNNWLAKHHVELLREWIERVSELRQTQPVRWFLSHLRGQLKDDALGYGGWYDRHGGKLTFIGDHLSGASAGGIDAPTVLFVLLFFALMYRFGRDAAHAVESPKRRQRPPSSPTAKSSARRPKAARV